MRTSLTSGRRTTGTPSQGGDLTRAARWARVHLPGYLLHAVPSLLLVILSVPTFSFTYLSDDLNFLQRTWSFRIQEFLPDPRSAFYRPLSREAYFSLLTLLGRDSPFWGHLLNCCLAVGVVVLVTLLARRLAGARVGFLAGILLASLGTLPFLVGWVSGSQDLLAMFFIAAALHFQLSRRLWAALACTAAALLSKETSILFIPGLMTLRWVLHRDRGDLRKNVFAYLALGFVWVVIHPKMRSLLHTGFATGSGGYVGLDNPRVWINVAREFATLVNLPVTGPATRWPSELTLVAVGGAVVLWLGFWTRTSLLQGSEARAFPLRRLLIVGGLLGVGPAILSAASVKHWAPYYTCLPAIGTALILALVLEKLPWRASQAFLIGYLILGIWPRGVELGTRGMPTEQNFRVLSRNLRRVESEIKKLHPSFPSGSQLYVSVQAPRESGMETHLIVLQAPRVWYSNRTIVMNGPERFRRSAGPEYLFWVTPSSDVFEIGLPELRVRSPGPRPDYFAYQKTVRGYAYGLFGAGEVDRAVAVLLSMQEVSSFHWAFDRRLAATMLYASGRPAEAQRLCAGLPPLKRMGALYAIAAVLSGRLETTGFDEAAFAAFGVSTRDAEAYRFLMNYFSDQELLRHAKQMAERLLALRPGDWEASAMIEAIQKVPHWEQVVAPVDEEE